MKPEDKVGRNVWLVLDRLNTDLLLAPVDEHVKYQIQVDKPGSQFPSEKDQIKILEKLQSLKAIRIIKEYMFAGRGNTYMDRNIDLKGHLDALPKGMLIEILPAFENIYQDHLSRYGAYQSEEIQVAEKFTIAIRDRNVWVNDYLLSKPFATSKGMALLEYLLEHVDETIERKNAPEFLRQELSNQPFTKLMSNLGFKGQILITFVPLRSKSQVKFRNPVSSAEAVESGVDIQSLELELKLAHRTNTKGK